MLQLRKFNKALLSAFLFLPVTVLGAQGAVDIGISTTTQSEGLGLASHYQIIGAEGLGFDFGYEYLDEIEYEALDASISHEMRQLEAGMIYQVGDQGIRMQFKGSTVMSLTEVDYEGSEVIARYQTGYQLGVGLSAPIYSNFRAFVEAGYQGWINAEVPFHLRWRYGIRMMFGQSPAEKERALRLAEQAEAAEQARILRENPPTTINAGVPKYIPGHMSESLPPIVAFSELCKCFPAGPYTLQLGEFSNMQQAIRGLEYRGLRQFFNSYAYQREPLAVFLSQTEENGPVGLYIGEIETLDKLAYWQHELKKNALNARMRKVINGGDRQSNASVKLVDVEVEQQPLYSEEEIRRMNSLPDDSTKSAAESADSDQLIAEKEAYQQELQAMQAAQNQVNESGAMSIGITYQMGPMSQSSLESLLSGREFKSVLSSSGHQKAPERLNLVWDEGKQEAWLSFTGFASEQHADEWQAWLESAGYVAEPVSKAFVPMGDVYHFQLAEPLQEFSVEIDRSESVSAILSRMRSAEVLWFHAFQRINDQPVLTSLNWSNADERYHLIVINVASAAEQADIWGDLTAVGLLPSLAEP
ncbi:hypothetical protein [Reinekea marinisedimentorum]|uniref:SPOR domain-containing protein n=1 Tax=Reinekea marinisedimentorum TaxID=230495 RepID=A0A4R3I8R6_9GAMM|nr:hypothetical protein [Reinekea marinisedimentorum]TCS42663.1 hypothetical protein BCF53_103331 [Reinekea marinisedimentorum]